MACRVAGVLQLQRTSAIFANGFPLYAEMTMAGLIRVIGWCGAFVLFVAACDGPERQAAVAPAAQPPLAAQSAIPDVRAGTVGLDTIRVDTVYVLADTSGVPAQLRASAKETARDVGRLSLRVLLALLVMIGAFWLVKLAVKALEVLAERSATRRLFFKKLVPSVRLLIWSAAIYYVVAGVFRISAQDLLLAAAAIGVAIGFAAQDILKNIFGGIIIVFDQPFQVGDKVSVGGTYGEVVSIGAALDEARHAGRQPRLRPQCPSCRWAGRQRQRGRARLPGGRGSLPAGLDGRHARQGHRLQRRRQLAVLSFWISPSWSTSKTSSRRRS